MRNYNISRNTETSCNCEREAGCVREAGRMREPECIPSNFVVGMAYVPWQNLTTVYEPHQALEAGTIFPELDKPFWAGRGMCRR